MKTLQITLLLFIAALLTLQACQEKESMDEFLSDEVKGATILEMDEKSRVDAADLETQAEGPDAPEIQTNHNQYIQDFTILNRMFEKMVLETFVQSHIKGLPGFHNGAASRSACPDIHLSDPSNYPTTLTLDYGVNGCTPVLGLEVAGIMEAGFSGPIDQAGTIINLLPHDNFNVSDHDIDVSDPNALSLSTSDGVSYTLNITSGEYLSVRTPDNYETRGIKIGAGNSLTYNDNGTNSSPVDVLDDKFVFEFSELHLLSSDGSTVSLQTVPGNGVVYDMICDCIQDGKVQLFEDGNLVKTFDYGYSESGATGICNDEILVIANDAEQTETVMYCP